MEQNASLKASEFSKETWRHTKQIQWLFSSVISSTEEPISVPGLVCKHSQVSYHFHKDFS